MAGRVNTLGRQHLEAITIYCWGDSGTLGRSLASLSQPAKSTRQAAANFNTMRDDSKPKQTHSFCKPTPNNFKSLPLQIAVDTIIVITIITTYKLYVLSDT
jgi:hypothetical protein